MSSNVINLRTARKRKARSEIVGRAFKNRLKFGRDRRQRLEDHRESEKAERHLDGRRLETTENV